MISSTPLFFFRSSIDISLPASLALSFRDKYTDGPSHLVLHWQMLFIHQHHCSKHIVVVVSIRIDDWRRFDVAHFQEN